MIRAVDMRYGYRPRNYSAKELAKVGVNIADADEGLLRCNDCDHVWRVTLRHGGCRSFSWICPNGCNL